MIGERFTRLVVLDVADTPRRGIHFECLCDCGQKKVVRSDHLRGGKVQSCGCLHKELSRQRANAGIPRKNMDGHSKRPEYNVWLSLRQRCKNSANPHYKYYGERGITVCDRWDNSFHDFIADMGARPSSKHTIERIDNGKGYSPDNCKWATRRTQQNNLRSNNKLTYRGRTQTLAQWSRETGIHRNTLDQRIAAGWTIERALTVPPRSEMDLSGLALGVDARRKKRAPN